MSFPRYPAYKASGVVWLGEVPEHWGVSRVGYLCERIGSGKTPRGGSEVYTEAGVLFIRSQNVYDDGLRLDDVVFIDDVTDAEMKWSRVESGDVLLNITGASIGRTCIVPGDFPSANVNQHVCVLRSRDAALRVTLSLFLKSSYAKAQIELSQTGAARDGLNYSQISAIRIPVPPASERGAIATFLDRETAKIDALGAEYRTLIELLKEKREAVISHAVTKGLDPTVPMKDSGVEWLGEVPEHWEAIALSRITSERCDGPFGTAIKSNHYTDEGARVIRLRNIRAGRFDGTDEAFLDLGYFEKELSGHDVVAGDVLIAGLGDENNQVGRACVAPGDLGPALVKADCFRFRLDKIVSVPSFIAMQLSAGASFDGGYYATGTTRQKIPLSVTGRRRIVLPPVAEQRAIACHIDVTDN